MKQERLKGKMVEHSLRDQDMAKLLGIDSSTFYRKKNGVTEFTREEIKIMKNLLNLSADEIDSIFFDD